MNILLLGGGGREHALAMRLAQSPRCEKLYAAPGNPGIAMAAQLVALNPGDHGAVIQFCREAVIDLVVVGPEAPLVAGIADDLRHAGIAVFGPSAAAAQLEGSKAFTKALCQRAAIPTAAYVHAADLAQALAALDGFAAPYVLKADGLAAGKGVVIAETRAEAEAALRGIFAGQFGAAGAAVVIEEFMVGEEVSFFAISDGVRVIRFGSAQDHKRVGDGDTGPNTGGMGAYSPAPQLSAALEHQVMADIITPTVRAMADAGTPYVGVLFAGLMLTDTGPRLIEYNARFGDPECQVLMTRLESDLVELLFAAATGRLAEAPPVRLSEDFALTVVMAANGYPGAPIMGGVIGGVDAAQAEGAVVFHAGTAMADGRLVASGGRVLNVTARGSSVTQAQQRAYAAVDRIDFPGGFCRRDIGWREVARESTAGH